MIKKIGLLILITFLSTIIASIYGFLHNQISYTISTEYYTEFKFDQFWSIKYVIDFPRMSAGLIGVASTWWIGFLIGLINGIVGLIHPTTKEMWKGFIGATLQILKFTILLGFIGAVVGYLTLLKLQFDWIIPSSVVYQQNFLAAATMHFLSYLGGIIGLIYGIRYQLKIKKPVPNNV